MTPPTAKSDGVTNMPVDFLAGADMSHLAFFEQRGIVYRAGGQPEDALEILKDRGLNCVRLRLFTSSAAQAAADPYNYINNLDYVVPLAMRVKQAGLKLLLDFHYSDTWADPGDQLKPNAWTSLQPTELEQQIRGYSSNCIARLNASNALPDYVQVGNEIIGGMLWDDGRVGGDFDTDAQWAQLGRLLKAGIQGIKDAAGANPPKIVIHIDRGADWTGTKWFFDKLNQEQVPYDIIGQSYYSWWHGNLENLQNCLSNAAVRYDKPIIVAETAFPWTNSSYDPNLGFDYTPEGQAEYAAKVAKIVKELPNGKGIGLFWWGAEYVRLRGYNLADFHRTSFFDYDGNVLPVVRTLGQLTLPVKIGASREQSQLRLQWPLSGAGMSLVTTTSPAPNALWMGVTNSTSDTAGVFSVTLPLGRAAQQFFRLEND